MYKINLAFNPNKPRAVALLRIAPFSNSFILGFCTCVFIFETLRVRWNFFDKNVNLLYLVNKAIAERKAYAIKARSRSTTHMHLFEEICNCVCVALHISILMSLLCCFRCHASLKSRKFLRNKQIENASKRQHNLTLAFFFVFFKFFPVILL